jgi:hypothetical protein
MPDMDLREHISLLGSSVGKIEHRGLLHCASCLAASAWRVPPLLSKHFTHLAASLKMKFLFGEEGGKSL